MFGFYAKILFIVGFIFGVLLATFVSLVYLKSCHTQFFVKHHLKQPVDTYKSWFSHQKIYRRLNIPKDVLQYSKQLLFTESQYLYKKVKVLCIVLVHKVQYLAAVNGTWAAHCNKMLYIKLDLILKLKMPKRKTRDNSSWSLLCTTLRNIIGAPWVFILRDDTFAILENTRYIVAGLDSAKTYYLGHAMKFWGVSYNSGHAGYLLSNGALLAFQKKFINEEMCRNESTYWNQEDYYLGMLINNNL